MAMNQDERKYLVGECKFKNSPFSYLEYLNTVTKLSTLKENIEFYYTLFSLSGFDEKIISEAQETKNIKLYSLNDIVNIHIKSSHK